MTREECLDWLYRLKSEIFVYMPEKWLVSMGDALEIAIEALEHPERNVVKVVPCGDAISREAVLDAISRIGLCKSSANEVQAVKECLIATETLPSVTPQSKTVLYSGDGYADGYIVYDMAECPNCGYKYEDGDKDWRLPFCPNCGQSLDWESEDKE